MPHSDRMSDKIQSLDLIFSHPGHGIGSCDFLRGILGFEEHGLCLMLENGGFDENEVNNRGGVGI